MSGYGLKDVNTAEKADVVPSSKELKADNVVLDKASWNVLRYNY